MRLSSDNGFYRAKLDSRHLLRIIGNQLADTNGWQSAYMGDSLPSLRNWVRWLVLAAGAFVFCIFIWGSPNPWHEMPEPRNQRAYVSNSIVRGGGWDVFKAECDSLISQTQSSGQHYWNSGQGHLLPPSCKILSALKPYGVSVYTAGGIPDYVNVVVFDDNWRRGPLRQSYSLIYQQTTNSDRCFAESTFSRPEIYRFNKITNSVFEVYLR